MSNALGTRFWLLPAAAFALPLGAALAYGVAGAFDAGAWRSLWADPALAPALGLSLWVGSGSIALSLGLTLWLVTRLHGSPAWRVLQHSLGALLAVPHAAFAVGLALLVMPSGLLSRGLAQVIGWDAPPDIATVQDPAGLALIAGLVLKELPFLLWNVASLAHRVGQSGWIEGQMQLAQSMGYPARSVWWRVIWPQWLPQLGRASCRERVSLNV